MPNEVESRPAWWRCTSSADPRFTKGVAYEVHRYDQDGRAIIATDVGTAVATLPVARATFVAHDPWAHLQHNGEQAHHDN